MFISFSHEKDLLRLIESNVMSGRRCHLKRREKKGSFPFSRDDDVDQRIYTPRIDFFPH